MPWKKKKSAPLDLINGSNMSLLFFFPPVINAHGHMPNILMDKSKRSHLYYPWMGPPVCVLWSKVWHQNLSRQGIRSISLPMTLSNSKLLLPATYLRHTPWISTNEALLLPGLILRTLASIHSRSLRKQASLGLDIISWSF
jgi:hypothetical protein